ncbi:Dr1-associated corepressor [Pseudolycoriella hygida]|uniref:Dr1-associated corepressor n=1 Tax=Pseudolycoriella hygida TaxID=35572 RepID=A0A9Q0S8M2_9DIPT|nr:Dr1-associated corepressor [Pseudolycoriella hygida]
MPSKKRKYNQRFPAGRIKKIMQSDEEVGKVAQAVPIIIYILFECFVMVVGERVLYLFI